MTLITSNTSHITFVLTLFKPSLTVHACLRFDLLPHMSFSIACTHSNGANSLLFLIQLNSSNSLIQHSVTTVKPINVKITDSYNFSINQLFLVTKFAQCSLKTYRRWYSVSDSPNTCHFSTWYTYTYVPVTMRFHAGYNTKRLMQRIS